MSEVLTQGETNTLKKIEMKPETDPLQESLVYKINF